MHPTQMHLCLGHFCCKIGLKIGPWYGGVQNVWGEENVPENVLSRKFLDPSKRAFGLLCRGFLYRKNRAVTPEGGGKRTVWGGVKPLFGRGVIREVFLPPLFSTPPWRPLKKQPQNGKKVGCGSVWCHLPCCLKTDCVKGGEILWFNVRWRLAAFAGVCLRFRAHLRKPKTAIVYVRLHL